MPLNPVQCRCQSSRTGYSLSFKFQATARQTPNKSQTIFQYQHRRPIDTPYIVQQPFNTPAPAKYYRKVACPCDSSLNVRDVFGDVRTCPKVIGGSSRCVPLNANSNINANVDVSGGLLVKKYYTSNREYMQARCKTFEQKSFHFAPFSDNSGNANCCGNNGPTGSHYVTGNCDKSIYKRSNSQFSKQGAVSASNRLLRLKYNTITASSGANRANCPSCVKYPSNQTQNVNLRAYTPNLCFHKNGNKTIC